MAAVYLLTDQNRESCFKERVGTVVGVFDDLFALRDAVVAAQEECDKNGEVCMKIDLIIYEIDGKNAWKEEKPLHLMYGKEFLEFIELGDMALFNLFRNKEFENLAHVLFRNLISPGYESERAIVNCREILLKIKEFLDGMDGVDYWLKICEAGILSCDDLS